MPFGWYSPRQPLKSPIFRHLIRNVWSSPIVLISHLIHLSDNSDRVAAVRGEKLFPPYTQLGWDQSAWRLRDIDVEDVSKIDHIAGYGRPL